MCGHRPKKNKQQQKVARVGHRGTGCTQVSTEATANEHQPAGPCVVLRQNGVSAVSGSSLGLQTSL